LARQTLFQLDHGAIGGIFGDSVRIIPKTDRLVNVTGIDNHQLQDLWIVHACKVFSSDKVELLFVMHQYACNPGHQTMHSSMQIEHFVIQVDDRSIVFGYTHMMTKFCLSGFRMYCNILLSALSHIMNGSSYPM